jgi:hypothetical protein
MNEAPSIPPLPSPDFDLDLPSWDAATPIRPVIRVPWGAVTEHFRPWVERHQQRAETEPERLHRNVSVPFIIE